MQIEPLTTITADKIESLKEKFERKDLVTCVNIATLLRDHITINSA